MAKPGRTGLARIIAAGGYSWQGIRAAFVHEAAFRQELALCAVLVPLGFVVGDGPVEKAVLVGSLLLVLIVELLNSGLESIVDRVGAEAHELSGRAKDMGSAAVLFALINAGVIWLLILIF